MITIDAREFLATKTLSAGSHGGDRTSPDCAMCAREALCYAVTGEAYDRTPDGYPSWWAALTPLNDALADEERNAILRPRLWRYAIPASPVRDARIVRRLVTLAVTVFAADAAERHGLHEHARRLRACSVAGRRNSAAAADACAAAADACRRAAAACDHAANAAYHLNPSAECVYSPMVHSHDHLAEAASASAFAAAYAAATDAERRSAYFRALLDAIDEELELEPEVVR
jgi:hypothetical protein